VQRAAAVKYKIDLFMRVYGVHPAVFQSDCTGWDAHMTYTLCTLECLFYCMCFPKWNWYVSQLVECLVENKFSGNGIRGKVRGARMSGDMHTGLGNTLIMLALLVTAFRLLDIKRYDLLSDGDDTLIFIHPDDVAFVTKNLVETFLRMGHELRIEGVAASIYDITWCQCKIVRVMENNAEVGMFVQNPLKTFATLGSHIHARTLHDAYQYFADVLYAYSILYSAIPLFRKLGVMRAIRDKRTRRISPGLTNELLGRVHVTEGPNTLYDYCTAFNISPSLYRGDGVTLFGFIRALFTAFVGREIGCLDMEVVLGAT